MVQGKYSTLTYKQTTTNIFYIFSNFLLTNERNATYLYKMGHCSRMRMWHADFHDLVLRFFPPMVVNGNLNQGVYGVNSTYNVEKCGKKVSSMSESD